MSIHFTEDLDTVPLSQLSFPPGFWRTWLWRLCLLKPSEQLCFVFIRDTVKYSRDKGPAGKQQQLE